MKTRKIRDGYYLVDHTGEEQRERQRITTQVLGNLVKEVASKSASTEILVSYRKARSKSGNGQEPSQSEQDAVLVK